MAKWILIHDIYNSLLISSENIDFISYGHPETHSGKIEINMKDGTVLREQQGTHSDGMERLEEIAELLCH